MLWSLIAVAFAAEPTLVLPADQDPSDWRAAAALTGFRIGATGSGREVELRREGGGWVLVARDGRGLERRAGIAAPGTARSREDAMWLGSSLLASLPAPPGASSLSLALESGGQRAGSAAPPASSGGTVQGVGHLPAGAAPTSTRRSGVAPKSMGSDPGAAGAVAAPPRSAAKRPAPGSVSPASSVSPAKGQAPASAATGRDSPTVASLTGATQPEPSTRSGEPPSPNVGEMLPLPREVPPPLSMNPAEIGRSGPDGASAVSGTPGSVVEGGLSSTVLPSTAPDLDTSAPDSGRPQPENSVAAAPTGELATPTAEPPRAGLPSTVLDATAPSTEQSRNPTRATLETAGAPAAEGDVLSPLATQTEAMAASISPAPSKGPAVGAWVGVGGALELRSGLSGGAGGALEAGLHRSPSLWLGAALRWIEPRTIPAIEGATVEPTRDLSLGLFWSPERPVAPWLGAGLGSSTRSYSQGARTVADLRVPVASLELGLRVDLDPRWSIGLVARGAQDLDVTEVIYGSRAPQTLPGWAVDLRSSLRATFP